MKFDDLLLESKQVGTLYHFTNIEQLESILSSNTMISSPYSEVSIKLNTPTISFTRSKNGVIDKNPESRNFNKPVFNYGGIRIAIDGNKLSNKYKIKPIDYSGIAKITKQLHNMEEVILTKKIDNIKSYIIDIKFVSSHKKQLNKYQELKDIYTDIKFL